MQNLLYILFWEKIVINSNPIVVMANKNFSVLFQLSIFLISSKLYNNKKRNPHRNLEALEMG